MYLCSRLLCQADHLKVNFSINENLSFHPVHSQAIMSSWQSTEKGRELARSAVLSGWISCEVAETRDK